MKDVVDQQTGEVLSDYGPINNDEVRQYAAAWLECQMSLPLVVEKNANGHKYKYASLPSIMKKIRPILNEHKFFMRQGQSRAFFTEAKVSTSLVYTDIWHAPTCLYKRTQLEIPVPKLDAQAAGSALTYGKRYTLLAACGIADGYEDDDGVAALPNKINVVVAESPTLQKLKAQIDKVKAATELIGWPEEPKINKEIQKLNEAETALLRSYWSVRKNALVKEAQAEEMPDWLERQKNASR